ncbi:sensor histidine kinase [Amycolatopsis sp. NPDC059657]|uniref:sensor histidine kinase n=1 Tax=Amycolatopsis sp. NPDC059657 TaxID=3346899 RepID=UPI00366E6704
MGTEARDRLLSAGLAVGLLAVYGSRWTAVIAIVAGCVLLLWRRRFPLLTLAVIGSALIVGVGWRLEWADPLLFLGWIALYGAPAFAKPRHAAYAGIAVVLGTTGVIALITHNAAGRGRDGLAIGLVFVVAYVTTAWLLGRGHRLRQAYLTTLEDRAERLAREREAVRGQAVAEERSRIARELHDMLAHTMSGMVVLAGGARLATKQDDAVRALAEIERSGRRGMDETRRLLSALRAGDSESPPTLADLPALVARMSAAGLPVTVGAVPELPFAVDVAAYRIVQESLTNTLRHAGNATAFVEIRAMDGVVELAITDTGTGSLPGAGHGIAGMRERARLLGGELSAGPEPGGWAVRATVPLEVR